MAGQQPDTFLAYNGKMPLEERLRLAGGWLETHDLVLAYISEVDTAGHDYGPESKQLLATLANVDSALERFIKEARFRHPDLSIVLVGDHGMVQIEHRLFLDQLLPLWSEKLAWVDAGAVVFARPAPGFSPEGIIDEINENCLKLNVPLEAMLTEKLPARFEYSGNPRIAPITVMMPPVLDC